MKGLRTLPALVWGLLLIMGSCREPYTPGLPAAVTDLLVVDGFINSQGSTSIKLSRTNTLANANKPPTAESKATVYVQDEAGARYRRAVEDHWRYSVSATIASGSTEIQRILLSRSLLGAS